MEPVYNVIPADPVKAIMTLTQESVQLAFELGLTPEQVEQACTNIVAMTRYGARTQNGLTATGQVEKIERSAGDENDMVTIPRSAAVCGARHYILAYESFVNNAVADLEMVCRRCRYARSCQYQWHDTAAPLFDAAGVYPIVCRDKPTLRCVVVQPPDKADTGGHPSRE